MVERKQYALLDVLKFLLIGLIMLSHTANEHAHLTGMWHYVFSLYNFGVPFCFACSGYLFFSKVKTLPGNEKSVYYKKYSIRLGKMYLAWSIIYISFTICSWLVNGVTSDKILSSIHGWLVYSTYATIWFVPALWICISITYWLWKNRTCRTVLIVASVLFVFGNLMGSYVNFVKSFDIIEAFHNGYMMVFRTFRNGVFNGVPFVVLGFLVAKKQNTWSTRTNLLFVLLFTFFVVGECAVVKFCNLSTMTDMVFMLAPAIYFLLLWATKVEVKYNNLFLWMRNMSMLVFLSQRIFLSAIPSISVGYSNWIKSMSQLQIMIVLPLMTLLFSWTIIVLSKRISLLKVLW